MGEETLLPPASTLVLERAWLTDTAELRDEQRLPAARHGPTHADSGDLVTSACVAKASGAHRIGGPAGEPSLDGDRSADAHDPRLVCHDNRMGAAADLELGEDVADVRLDRRLGDEEPARTGT